MSGDPPGISIPDALGRTWLGSALAPTAFFRSLPRRAAAGPALLYYLAVGIGAAGARLFWRSVLPPPGDSLGTPDLGTAAAAPPLITDFLLSPLTLLISLALATAVVHAALWILGGARHGIGLTLRVLCYASSPRILAVVPFFGGAVGGVWMLVLVIVGLREAHGTGARRVIAAILLPALIFLALVAALAVAAAVGGALFLRGVVGG